MISLDAFSQTVQEETREEESLQELAEYLSAQESGLSNTDILEDLEYYRLHPLNLNTAGATDLQKLHLLNELQIAFLLKQRELYGQFRMPQELNLIEGFDSLLVKRLLLFTQVGPLKQYPLFSIKTLDFAQHEVIVKSGMVFPRRKGFMNLAKGRAYPGPQQDGYIRWVVRSDDRFSAGITAQNDAGEPFFSSPNQKGFDFYSFHLWAKPDKLIESFCIGDYKISTGLGLCLGTGFALQKSSQSVNIPFGANGLRPYHSSDENQFYRGAAVVLHCSDLHLSLFSSFKDIDGTLHSDKGTNQPYLSALPTDGLHRTAGELKSRHTTDERISGLLLSCQRNNLSFGLNFISLNLQYPLLPDTLDYNRYYFRGKRNYNLSGEVHWIYRKMVLAGEVALSKSGGIGAIQQISYFPSQQISFAMILRHYDRDFNSIRGNSFAASSHNRNETGLYTGAEILPFPKIKFNLWLDEFKFPGISYRTSSSTNGYETFFSAEYTGIKNLLLNFRTEQNKKELEMKDDQNKKLLVPVRTTRYRLTGDLSMGSGISLKSRIESCFYKALSHETGWLFLQDLNWAPSSSKFNIWYRTGWFNTPSYNSRIYASEHDLLYSFSIPAFYGKGMRFASTVRYRLSKKTDLRIKLSRTQRLDNLHPGSGYDEINANHIDELKIQIRLKL
ncbi:MAG: helix-hairpin-helix domain-containing protein [Bacteroidota bacterium]|nr:helix-hairpin-helix domain-containing protein [Bacteroidota bacterium]